MYICIINFFAYLFNLIFKFSFDEDSGKYSNTSPDTEPSGPSRRRPVSCQNVDNEILAKILENISLLSDRQAQFEDTMNQYKSYIESQPPIINFPENTPIRTLNDVMPPHSTPITTAVPPTTFQPPLNDTSSYPPYYSMSIKDIINTVPIYDGANLTFFQFARSCKGSKKMIPPDAEPCLVRMLRSRLKGHAYLAIEDEEFVRIDDLLQTLKRIFAPNRSHYYYKGELARIFMKPQEHIMDYIGRIKDLHTAIIEEEGLDRPPFSQVLLENVDRLALSGFIEGLPVDCKMYLRLEGYRKRERKKLKTKKEEEDRKEGSR